jgi:hypothetical protein
MRSLERLIEVLRTVNRKYDDAADLWALVECLEYQGRFGCLICKNNAQRLMQRASSPHYRELAAEAYLYLGGTS